MAEGTLMFVKRTDSEDAQLETVGQPMCPDDEVMLLDEEDNVVPFGEVGEFCVRGPYTLRGYFAADEHNARAFTNDGFYRSGDLLRQHPSGNYMVEGRIKDLINRGGEKISAEEIENLILMHPAVRNVACVPMPDARLGERMCAFLILHPGRDISLETLVAFLETREIARFKLPERIEAVDSFPGLRLRQGFEEDPGGDDFGEARARGGGLVSRFRSSFACGRPGALVSAKVEPFPHAVMPGLVPIHPKRLGWHRPCEPGAGDVREGTWMPGTSSGMTRWGMPSRWIETSERRHTSSCALTICTATPTPSPGSTARGPYVKALAEYWKRDWSAKEEDEVVRDFAEAGVDAVLVALDLEETVGTPPCSNDYVAGMWKRHPERIVQAWGAVDPLKGEAAISEAEHAVRDLGLLGFHFHPIMGRFAVNEPRFYPLVGGDRRARRAGHDRCRHHRHGRGHAGRARRQDPPRPPVGDRRPGGGLPDLERSLPLTPAGRGSRK